MPRSSPPPRPIRAGAMNTLARLALVRRDYPRGVPVADIVARLNALPGPQCNAKGVANMAALLGLRRAAPIEAVVTPPAAKKQPGARGVQTVPPRVAPSVARQDRGNDNRVEESAALLHAAAELRAAAASIAPAFAAAVENMRMVAAEAAVQFTRLVEATLRDMQAHMAARITAPPIAAPPNVRKSALFCDARDALVRERYAAEGASGGLLAAINALPGPEVSPTQVGSRAHRLGVRVVDYSVLQRARWHDHAANHPRVAALRFFSPERDAVLRAHYPDAGAGDPDLLAALMALPGGELTRQRIVDRARALGLRVTDRRATMRAAVARRAPGPASVPAEAAEDISELTPAGFRIRQIEGEAEPAPPTPPAARGSPSPPDTHVAPSAARSDRGTASTVEPAAAAAPPVQPAGPVRIAAPGPRLTGASPLSALPTPAQRQRQVEAQMIADHVAKNGVTRCPTAAIEATTAAIAEADRAAIRAHDEAQRQAALDEHARRVANVQANRARKMRGQPLVGFARA